MINAQYITPCGGSGARLWPLSRIGLSKQFLCLTGKERLFPSSAQQLAKPGCNQLVIKELQSDSHLGEVVTAGFEDKCGLTKLKKSSGVAPHGCQ